MKEHHSSYASKYTIREFIFIIIFFYLLYLVIFRKTSSAEDEIKALTDEEKEKYKEYNRNLTPHEQDVLKHPEYWGNPLNRFFYNLFNK